MAYEIQMLRLIIYVIFRIPPYGVYHVYTRRLFITSEAKPGRSYHKHRGMHDKAHYGILLYFVAQPTPSNCLFDVIVAT